MYDAARLEGVLLDPVYTSKAMAGLRGLLAPDQTTLFVHTGGVPAIFGYSQLLAAMLDEEGLRR